MFTLWISFLLLLVPGLGFARQSGLLARLVAGMLVSCGVLASGMVVARWLGAGGLVGWGLLWTGLGWVKSGWKLPERWERGVLILGLGLLVGGLSWGSRLEVGIERFMWDASLEEDFSSELPVLPWEQAPSGVLIQHCTGRCEAGISGPIVGNLVVSWSGPVGSRLRIEGEGVEALLAIERDVEVDPEEGLVPRYLQQGMAAKKLELNLPAGQKLAFQSNTEGTVRLIASTEQLWEAHERWEFRVVHYYQLLNMVEQFRWAEELLKDRWVTDVQPPAWVYLLGGLHLLSGADLPAANVLTLWMAFLWGLGALKLARGVTGELLVAMGALVQAKLLFEPGSGMMPDMLYSAALMHGLVALILGGSASGWVLLAQLARYPGTLVGLIGAILSGQWREGGRILGAVALAAGAFGAVGLVTGELEGWLETVAWETGPEHWHGEYDLGLLWSRVPEFYGLWFQYSGGGVLLGLLGFNERACRVLVGTALLYSLLLCTIDHFPSHYFVPLVGMVVVGVASLEKSWLKVIGIAGLCWMWFFGAV